jgi:endoglucanase
MRHFFNLTFLSLIFLVAGCSPMDQSKEVEESTVNTPKSNDWLKVAGDRMVNLLGDTVTLRGFGLGGMLHMENFINGFPANEQAVRTGLLEVLGQERYDLFFNEFYNNYFTEEDAQFIHELGLNLVRVAISYHQFEDDMNPGVINEDAFVHLDRVISLCAKYGIYTIIDFHAMAGFQNQHWHSDNPTHKALFWEYKHFQDRALKLWEVIADRYKDEPWVAGYDLMNEPADPTEKKVFAYLKRLYETVRVIDPNHIIFIEGNRYAIDFDMFTEIWDNVVYTNHDYAIPGFIDGGDYPGISRNQYYDKDSLERDFLERSAFMMENKVPLWVGEFGPVYTGIPAKDEMRYQVLKDQLAYYEKYEVSWCLWLYKDLGLQAILYQDDSAPYMQLVADFLKKKKRLGADAWGSTDEHIRHIMDPIRQLYQEEFPEYDPFPFGQKKTIDRVIRHILIAEALVPEYCQLFEGLTDDELLALARSFNYKNYNRRERLVQILKGKEM